ncbi:hypothetical protein [Peterkaempfera bronchialis]|uniref:Uncharacterized protein n=1 Tax=Peterkaempfera bronchialis TaxID=2126346 RepID=A0A345SRC4_9ACTN|nr:hypothetical protein [Peterkaempfera bronchialis]AXI76279.1 hypothetical protein C7M71_001095 [Peterkaempfera bronchialis]
MTITLTFPRLPLTIDRQSALRVLLPVAEFAVPALAEASGASFLLRLGLAAGLKVARSAAHL